MNLNKLCLAVLAACMSMSAVQAAETIRTSGIEVTATRVARDLMDVPMSTGVVTAEQIKESGVATIGELIQDIPGVELQNDGTPGLIRVSIRGEGTMRTTVLIDGQKVSEHKSMSGAPILIDPSAVERIEVIKGPASVQYGSDAIGGVINIITKKGGDKPVQFDIGAGYNGAGDGFTQNASVYGSSNGFKYRISGSNATFGDLRTPDGRVDNTDYNTQSGSIFLSYDMQDDVTVGLQGDIFRGEYHSGTDDPSYDDFAVNIDPWKREKLGLFVDAKNLNDYLARLRFDVYVQNTHKKMQNLVKQFPMNMDNHADNTIQSAGVSVQSEWQLGDSNYLIAGLGFDGDDLDAETTTAMDMSIPGSMQVHRTSYAKLEGGQKSTWAFLSNETLLPYDLTANYGVRYTRVETSVDNINAYYLPGSYVTPPGGSQIDYSGKPYTGAGTTGSEVNAKPVFNFGLIWRGIENTALRFNWAQGFRAPTIQEKFLTTSMGGGTEIGNPNLDPETSNNFEVGVRYDDRRLTLDAAAFMSLADDYITTKDVGNSTYQYYNVGKATTYGVEVSVAYNFDSGFTPYMSATFMRRQFDYGGLVGKTWDTNTPDFLYRAGLRYSKDFTDFNWHVDAFARGATDRDYTYENSGAVVTDHEAGYTTANLETGVSFGQDRQYSVTAAVLNILDKEYYVSDALPEAGVHAVVTFNASF